MWKSDVRVTPFFKNRQILTVSVSIKGAEDFFYSIAYASNEVEE